MVRWMRQRTRLLRVYDPWYLLTGRDPDDLNFSWASFGIFLCLYVPAYTALAVLHPPLGLTMSAIAVFLLVYYGIGVAIVRRRRREPRSSSDES